MVKSLSQRNHPASTLRQAPLQTVEGQRVRLSPILPSSSLPPQPTEIQQVLLDYVSQFARLTDAEVEGLLEMVKIREYEKGTLLLREGQVGNSCYFVLKGCVRQYYLIDGEEKTTQFYTEGQPVIATGFPYDNKPSKCYLVCNEDCVVVYGTPEDEVSFYEQLPAFQTVSRVGVEHELKKSQEALSEFIVNSPEGRYLNLLETRPGLLERVPQYQLASYLGVTPESLSRIRSRIRAGKSARKN